MLKVQEFCLKNADWRTKLAAAPYFLTIKEKDNLVLFKYNQIKSDFSLEIVQECRGLILELNSFTPVALAFKKFFNYGEQFAAKIDWDSARVTEKVDGSIITVYFYDKWRVKTNGTIDACDAKIESPYHNNYRELFDAAAHNSGFDFDKLDPHYCYTFELVSPEARIVVPYQETKLYHLSSRDMRTLEEVEINIGVKKPPQYWFNNLNEILERTKQLPYTTEGFVVNDKYENRIKIKTEDYLKVHRLRQNGTMNVESAINLIRSNETSEFLSYFPNYSVYIENIEHKLQSIEILINEINVAAAQERKQLEKFYSVAVAKKEFALSHKRSHLSYLWFLAYNKKLNKNWFNSLTAKQIGKIFEKELIV